MTDQVPALWEEIITWLRAHAPADAGRLRPPAPASLITEVQAAVGRSLPDDLRQWWQQADGAVNVAAVYLMPWGFAPMSCRATLDDRAVRLEIDEDMDDEYDHFGFDPRYLPIGQDHCGNCLYVDLRDGPEYGYVKFFDHEDHSPSGFYWRGITEMLTEIRDALVHDVPCLHGKAARDVTAGRNIAQVYRATVTPARELCWVPEKPGPTASPAPATTSPARTDDDVLRRYRDLLAGPHQWITGAMSWSVVTGQTDVASIIRRLGADPDTIVEHRPIDDDRRQPRWYLDSTAGTVTLLEVNGSQAARPVVLRQLSGRSNQMFSAFWNAEGDNAFSYAAGDDVVTRFDGRDPARRSGSGPDALATEQEPLWAAAGGSWQAAMLALVEYRTGVRLDADWFERPHPTVTAHLPDGPPAKTLNAEIFALLWQRENPRRHAAVAWLTRSLAERFDLLDPALLRAIEARRADVRVDADTERQVRDMVGEVTRQALAHDTTVPQHTDPVWRRGQAAMAAAGVLTPVDPSMLLLHAENAFADEWYPIATQLRARL
jgi:cell wall assembly regulator SMI1